MIEVGARVPDAEVFILDSGAPKAVRMTELCAGKRVALFGVPGAFTRTCSGQHLPGMVASADALGAKGVDLVACLAVNDVFVLAAWSREHDAGGKVTMIS
ncbi:MAG: redoxin family protein, partial [Hyphomicrobiaceae bacterium]|nr:redoxin family protein [Hyphomicrobiaceae bacterium]